MKTSLIVIDDVYNNPDQIRQMALGLEFNVNGNYPGQRTAPYRPGELLVLIEKAIQTSITNWNTHSYNGTFQLCTNDSIKTWIHSDCFNGWAGVIYLTPNAPLNSGTCFYRHKASGLDREPDPGKIQWDGRIYEQFDLTDRVANKYNRLVLYDASLFHASESYFGDSKETGRLFQTFFFSTT